MVISQQGFSITAAVGQLFNNKRLSKLKLLLTSLIILSPSRKLSSRR